jgi:hypothetical protein
MLGGCTYVRPVCTFRVDVLTVFYTWWHDATTLRSRVGVRLCDGQTGEVDEENAMEGMGRKHGASGPACSCRR